MLNLAKPLQAELNHVGKRRLPKLLVQAELHKFEADAKTQAEANKFQADGQEFTPNLYFSKPIP